MIYLCTLIFLAFGFYNIKGIKERQVGIETKPIYNIVLALSGILFFYLAYRLDRGLASYFLAFAALFYLFTSSFGQGMAEDGIFVLMGSSTIRKLARDDIKDIKIDKKKYQLSIYADSTIYKQKYKKADFPKVLEIIEGLK